MSATLSRTTSPTTGLAFAAIRAGRALEAWGREHARRRDDRRTAEVRLSAEATSALNERDALVWSTTFAPLI
jgi:hypothetical protein